MNHTAPLRLLLVHAHPDDETLTTGGTIAHYAARGVQITLVTCTLGEEGEIIPKELQGLASDQSDQLGGYRIGELQGACKALGVTDFRFLGGIGRWRDSGMTWSQPGYAGELSEPHPRAFAIGDRREQEAELETMLREVRPQVVVTYTDDGGYGHPDHVRAHQITMSATSRVAEVERVFHTVRPRGALADGLQRLSKSEGVPFPIADIEELAHIPDDAVTTALDVTDQQSSLMNALRSHETQISLWSDLRNSGPSAAGFALSNGIAQPILDVEHYVLASGTPDGCADDLFGT
ncbi:N-acetyl-1-D-myo-inositol-2-amino-2-deoxy-alpha-D-glucopyranoside deacetylase [Halopolyspora algeriensis]|uniref:1D-myo-inositol 2-acetamido-2-deoxy-alpha-D-glucopyranoside deacetylase n=1 Tax=Halopolyspora algeriensis TaxID=1500506 RepID=A0A368V8W4_9ACTN|nr:N-acetyl-1-D-myo-inositol-2-amino-2-deoxy-alpha-D-glucopyranoside deacetylase [Halopolyspora algeriensis]RCW37647.1 N-acetyl-1-D-myo-inositol-2-amino-2-deoxy-alpha-D-glucopyranoside deacetylase [Halopolyspora algeriensis]TQM53818.1 N-acetyl-1-D-myo-inositol-2-amino-2-deoxy-alpha-D-glucopyranoside deacetylase [Halopolyspora algeriensis]